MGRRNKSSGLKKVTKTSPLEVEELDIQAFSDALQDYNLRIRDVSNDGNCLFRAVSDQLYGSEDAHLKLRERACDYLVEHKDHYQYFIDDEQSFDDYISEMRRDGVWADNLELQAISMSCSVNIRVHQSGKPSYDIRNHSGKSAPVIHLSYHFGEHYASVRPLRTAELAIPAQHDPLPPPRSATVTTGSKERSSNQSSEAAPSRPKRPTNEDTVLSLWRRANRTRKDLHNLADQIRRAARAIRSQLGGENDANETRDIVKQIERDMRAARDALDEIAASISEGKSSHRFRKRKQAQEQLDKRTAKEAQEKEGLSSYSESDPDESLYEESVQRNTEEIFTRLRELESAILKSQNAMKLLDAEKAGNQAETSRTASKKHARGGKKKAQEAKKRERKERRRKEQQRIANGIQSIAIDSTPNMHDKDILI